LIHYVTKPQNVSKSQKDFTVPSANRNLSSGLLKIKEEIKKKRLYIIHYIPGIFRRQEQQPLSQK
jgi:hypothetical protein